MFVLYCIWAQLTNHKLWHLGLWKSLAMACCQMQKHCSGFLEGKLKKIAYIETVKKEQELSVIVNNQSIR